MDPKNTSNSSFDKRTSVYRGVTRHRLTGRYEAHLWDNSCLKDGHTRKGKQVYLGGFDQEGKAARAYDLAALKYWGPSILTNFPIENYERELEEMKNVSKEGYIQSIRRSSTGFSRGRSAYRGVTRVCRRQNDGRWLARIGRVAGNKDLYLGTFATQEDAAEAYDIAAIKFRGENAVTNFDRSRYDVKSIMNSTLPLGGKAKRTRVEVEDKEINGDDFSSTLLGLQQISSSINVEGTGDIYSCTNVPPHISKTKATPHSAILGNSIEEYSRGLVMGGSSLPSNTSLATPFDNIQEGLALSKAPAFENMLSLGTSTFCYTGQSSGLDRAVQESTVPDSNRKTPPLEDSESGPSAAAACQPFTMFNIWSDMKLKKS